MRVISLKAALCNRVRFTMRKCFFFSQLFVETFIEACVQCSMRHWIWLNVLKSWRCTKLRHWGTTRAQTIHINAASSEAQRNLSSSAAIFRIIHSERKIVYGLGEFWSEKTWNSQLCSQYWAELIKKQSCCILQLTAFTQLGHSKLLFGKATLVYSCAAALQI